MLIKRRIKCCVLLGQCNADIFKKWSRLRLLLSVSMSHRICTPLDCLFGRRWHGLRHLVSHWWILTNPLFSLVEIHNIDTGRSNLRVINQRKRPMCLPGMSGNEIRSIATPNVGTREFRVKRVWLLSVAAPDAGTRVQKIVNLIHI